MTVGKALLSMPGADSVLSSRDEEEAMLQHWEQPHPGCCLQPPAWASPLLDELQGCLWGLNTQECEGRNSAALADTPRRDDPCYLLWLNGSTGSGNPR